MMTGAAMGNPSMHNPGGMTTSSIGATALQAQPARAPQVRDEMAHLQRAATPRASEERHFIAPQAMEAGGRAAPAGEPARRSTLFEKMTSRLTGHPLAPQAQTAQHGTAQHGTAQHGTAQHGTAQQVAQPQRMAQAPAPQAPRAQVPQRAEPQRMEPKLETPAAQPMLNLDPADRIAAQRGEEDLLDIPAFLRRQAN
jgi:cell division protein FtsZ